MTERYSSINLHPASENKREQEKKRESVYDSIESFPVEFGTQSKDLFVRSLDSSLAWRKRPVVVVFFGESASDKTGLERDIAAEIFGYGKKKNTEVAKLIRQFGRDIPVEGISWGEVLTLTKFLGRTENPDVRFGEFTAKDNSEGTKVFAEQIAQSIREHRKQRRLIYAEAVGVTGIPWIKKNPGSDNLTNTEPFGYDRGVTAFWDLSGKKGPFRGLDFDVFWLGVVANPKVREIGKKVRGKLGDVVSDPQNAIKAIREAGIKFDPKKVNEIIEWAHSSASLNSIVKMEEQANSLMIRLSELGAFPVLVDDLYERPEYRAEVIGRFLMPYMLKYINVNERHVFIAYNHKPLQEVEFNTQVFIENTIIKRYPQIANIPNKRPADPNP